METYRVTKEEEDTGACFTEWEVDATSDLHAIQQVLASEGITIEKMNYEIGRYESIFKQK